MGRSAKRLAALTLIMAAIIASMPTPTAAPATSAAGGGHGGGHVVAAPLADTTRFSSKLDPYLE